MEDVIGGTPLVRLQRLPGPENERRGNVLLAKLEGNNPAGSVKDRPAISMIRGAEERGEISPGDTLLEATSGNTGIGLAMAAAISGYPLVIVMPEDASIERIQTMKAYGAELVLTPASGGMEEARDVVTRMEREGRGRVLDQFGNPDNPRAHEVGTGPELWSQTDGRITHFVSAMGTTGTITGVSRFLKSRNPAVQIVGAQPAEGSKIPGSRAWPPEYVPRRWPAGWPARRASSAASPRQARAGPHSRWRRRSRTRRSCSWSATGATGTSPAACSPPDAHRAGPQGEKKPCPDFR